MTRPNRLRSASFSVVYIARACMYIYCLESCDDQSVFFPVHAMNYAIKIVWLLLLLLLLCQTYVLILLKLFS